MKLITAVAALGPLLLFLPRPAPLQAEVGVPQDSLKLIISVEQPVIRAPYPIRLTMHLLNGGAESVWIYRRARSRTNDGSMLTVNLDPVVAEGSAEIATPAKGIVFESVALPRPKLIKLPPGEDYSEKATIKVSPALMGSEESQQPVWGRYRLFVTYRARYSNAEPIQRIVGVNLWQEEVTSNAAEIELQPPSGDASITGTVQGKENRPLYEVLVTLSDESEQLVDQVETDPEGRFAFENLPPGTYWVTVRRLGFEEDTTDFRHVILLPDAPDGTIDFLLLPREAYEPIHVQHKPVLFRITDADGRPLDKVNMELTWSNGVVHDSVKGETREDGVAVLDLIPGRNYATLKRRGCETEERRVDVAPGEGIDGFALAMNCARK